MTLADPDCPWCALDGDTCLCRVDLSREEQYEWEERAAIREYDGGQSREVAEAGATREILARVAS